MRPRALRPANLGFQAPTSHERVKELAGRHIAEKEAAEEEERRRRDAAAAAQPAAEPLKPAEEAGEESSSEYEEASNGEMLLPSARAKAEKEKQKRKKGKAKAKAKSLHGHKFGRGSASAPSLVAAGSADAAGSMLPPPQPCSLRSGKEMEAQSVQSGGSKKTKRSSGQSDVASRIQDLQVSKVLGGEALGDRFYAVKRKIDELECKEPGNAELVLLRAHQALAFVAQDRH